MTGRDFELIAQVIRNYTPLSDDLFHTNDEIRADLARDFADTLQAKYPRFNRDRFIAAATGTDTRR